MRGKVDRWVWGVALLLALGPSVGSQASVDTTGDRHSSETAPAPSPCELDLNGLGSTICPVMRPYDRSSDKFFFDYKGRRYYFCCGQCVEIFARNPEFFLQRMADEIKAFNARRAEAAAGSPKPPDLCPP